MNKKIFQFAHNDYDGASVHILNNHKYLIKNKLNSQLYLVDKTKSIISSNSIKLIFTQSLKLKLINYFKNFKLIKIYLNYKNPFSISFNKIKYSRKFINRFKFNQDDIFIFYGFNRVIDLNFLNLIPKTNIYFFPMDLEILSGGCHFDLDCIKLINKSHISLNKKNKLKKKILLNYKIKKNFFNKCKPKFIASNRGVMKIIKDSKYKINKIHLSYLLVNKNRNRYFEKKILRKKFHIDYQNFVILNMSINPYDHRKNINKYIEIIKYFTSLDKYTQNIKFIYVGNTNPIKNDLNNYIYIKSNFEDKFINMIYRLSDLYLDLSLSDNGPMSVFEAYMNNLNIIVSNKSLFSHELKYKKNVKLIDPNNFDEIIKNIKLCYETRNKHFVNKFDFKNNNLLQAIS